jgi:predicted Zn-dependent protease
LSAPGVVGVLAITDQYIGPTVWPEAPGDTSQTWGINSERSAVVMSYARLDPDHFRTSRDAPRPDAKKALLVERAVKQALDCTGFLLGVPRCKTKTTACVRSMFAQEPIIVEDLDKRPAAICKECRDAAAKRPGK